MGVSFSVAFSGLLVIFQVVLLGSFLVNLVLTSLNCYMWVGGSVDMVSPLALVRVVTFNFSSDGAATEFFNGTLKLRYSSTPFSKKFPSWPVPDLSGHHPVVGSGPGPSVHFPDRDPVFERPAKRFRFPGKSSAVRRELVSGDGLPTPKRWKRLVPQGTGMLRIEDGLPPFLFPRTGVG